MMLLKPMPVAKTNTDGYADCIRNRMDCNMPFGNYYMKCSIMPLGLVNILTYKEWNEMYCVYNLVILTIVYISVFEILVIL
jgi:hypothetical protein